jgi:hypothetical protein
MNLLAAILAIVACVLFVMEAQTRPNPPHWRLGWIGFALLTASLIIWHTVGGLEPVFND